jgi:hypothetical protein
MSRFRISPALWDKIHHYSTFPQTGGEHPQRKYHFSLADEKFLSARLFISLVAANGLVRSKSIPGNTLESFAILGGGVAHTAQPSSEGIGRVAGWLG